MCACYTACVKNKCIIKAFTFYILNFHFFLYYVFCPAHRDQKRVGIRSPGTRVTIEGCEQPHVFWESFLVTPECSAFSPGLYFLRHGCFKRMCGVDQPGTQTSMCLCLSPGLGSSLSKRLNWPRSGNINHLDFSRISCRSDPPPSPSNLDFCFHQCWKS